MNSAARLSRRRFIQAGAVVLAGTSLPWAAPLEAAAPGRWPAGCRDLHLKWAGKPDSWSCMRALGAQCTEVAVSLNLDCPNLFHPDRKYSVATEAGTRALKADLASNGCRISAFLMANRFDQRLEQELESARKLVQAAQVLGVRAIRIDVAASKLEGPEFLDSAVGACKRLCRLAEGTPVRFGVENHGKIANDPAFLDKLFAGVGSDRLGLTLDIANFYWWGHPLSALYGIYQRFAPRVIHTHCKNIAYPPDKRNVHRPIGWEYAKYNCPIYQGDIDFKRVLSILGHANYAGDLCVEDESLGKFPEAERAGILHKEIAYLKGLEA